MFPRFTITSASHRLAVTIIIVSIVCAFARDFFYGLFAFIPEFVVSRGFVWQLFTYLFIAMTPMGIIFEGLIIYSLGNTLEDWWGRAEFLRFVFTVSLLASILALPVCLLFPVASIPMIYIQEGPFVLASVIWVAYGLEVDRRGTSVGFWGLPIQGKTFALIGLGFPFLSGLFSSFFPFVPHLLAAGLTYLSYSGFGENLIDRAHLIYLRVKKKRFRKPSQLYVVRDSDDGNDDKPKTMH